MSIYAHTFFTFGESSPIPDSQIAYDSANAVTRMRPHALRKEP